MTALPEMTAPAATRIWARESTGLPSSRPRTPCPRKNLPPALRTLRFGTRHAAVSLLVFLLVRVRLHELHDHLPNVFLDLSVLSLVNPNPESFKPQGMHFAIILRRIGLNGIGVPAQGLVNR